MDALLAAPRRTMGKENDMGRNQHVTPHPDGHWQIKAAGSKRETKVTSTQAQAVTIARRIATHQGSELLIHGRDGKIRARDSHGHDSYPPKG